MQSDRQTDTTKLIVGFRNFARVRMEEGNTQRGGRKEREKERQLIKHVLSKE
jgi:hypothetical protein